MSNKKEPVLVAVPKKWVHTAVAVFICMGIMNLASFQFAYWVDSRSNKRLCGVVSLFNQAYEENPPPTELGKKIQKEMLNLFRVNRCSKT